MTAYSRRPLAQVALLSLALSGCVSAPEPPSTLQRTSPKRFEEVAACAYSALDRAYPAKVSFSDSGRPSSVRMLLRSAIEGAFGPQPRQADITVVRARQGSSIEIVSPTAHAEATWSEIQACA